MAWEGSDRRSRLPADWEVIRRVVIERADGQCEAIRSASGRRCPNPGRDVDHIVAGDDHRPEACQLLCVYHHKAKSAEEGHVAAAASRAKAKRPARTHPGLKG